METLPDTCECCYRTLDPMEVPISNLYQLSVRSYNCLKQEGIKTVGQLLTYSVRDLCRIKNAGPKTVGDIVGVLDDYGLSLPEQDSYPERKRREEYAHDVRVWGYVTVGTRERWGDLATKT